MVKKKKLELSKFIKVLSLLIVIPSLALNLFLFNKLKIEQEKDLHLVKEIFDGDTFYLDNQQKVRLLNFNAPELGICGSEQSKKRLEELILGKKVKLDQATTDVYGRSVALVYLGDELINMTMVKEGWGIYEGRKIDLSEQFVEASRNARDKGLGIYGPECYQKDNPDNPKCNIKGNVSKDNGEKIYHFPGCVSYSKIIIEKFSGDAWFCTEKEAQKAGFKKSETCYGKDYN